MSEFTKGQLKAIAEHMWIVHMHVKWITLRYGAFSHLIDFEQIGRAALVETMRRHDPRRGSFKQFAMYRVLGAMLDAIRAAIPGLRVVISAHMAAAVFCGHMHDEFKMMLHGEEDARGFLDEGGDGMLVVYFAEWVDAAQNESGEESLVAREDYVHATDALRAARAELDEEDEKLLTLLFHEDRTQEEAASMLEIGESTVYRRRQRALAKLRLDLERQDVKQAPRPLDIRARTG